MCAIAGMINFAYQESVAVKMLSTMLRRGPDAVGIFTEEECTLLHSRLSVIDPYGGVQPMHLDWAGERYTIVYNGELYNTDDVRSQLKQMGHNFSGHSDTEVVLHAYAQWGMDCLEKFNGIFAFGVWETRKNVLFLARDRIGVKPLFYKVHNNGLLFASEIKTILSYPTVKAELDADGAAQILLLGPGRIPGSGVLRGIEELEPGWCAQYVDHKLVKHQYWKLRDREHTDSFDDTVETVRYLVTDAITRQMVADVPLGTFLSGGLDSSLISSVCSNARQESGEQLKTFSVDYQNNAKYFTPGKFQPNADGEYIQLMVSYLNSDHKYTSIAVDELYGALKDATLARDLPGMADVDFSLLLFCKEIRKDVTVALSGECADEIFGGYPWYRDPEVRALDGFPWAQNTKQRVAFLADSIKDRIDGEGFIRECYMQTLCECDILPGTTPQEKRMKEMVNLNHRWFMQTLLDRKDRMSMYSGLEVRVPFCDYRIAEYMYAVPWEYKDYNGKEKGLLRFAMRDYLPDAVLNRKKSPYPKTYDPKYMSLVSEDLRKLIASDNAPIYQIVRKSALTDLLDAEYAWPWYGQLMRVPQTIAFMLQINTWLDAYNIDICV